VDGIRSAVANENSAFATTHQPVLVGKVFPLLHARGGIGGYQPLVDQARGWLISLPAYGWAGSTYRSNTFLFASQMVATRWIPECTRQESAREVKI
jgi:hypothetical protein